MWYGLGREFAQRGHAVTHISRAWENGLAEERDAGVHYVRLQGFDQPRRLGWLLALDLIYSIRAYRRVVQSEVIVTNTQWSPLLLGRSRGKVYVDVQRMPKGQMRFYRKATRLRANSSAVREAILAEVPDAAERIKVIPNPLPFVPRRNVNWNAKGATVLYVGRLHPEKGLELLLEAWRLIQKESRLSGWRLEIVGPGDAALGGGGDGWVAALRARAPANVTWLGAIHGTDELNQRYEAASVFVYPSLAEKGETFGLAVLEAMAWGAVPIVSSLACFRDFVAPGRNGILFDHRAAAPADALAHGIIEAASPECRVLGQAAIEVRKSHSLESIACQFLDDFATLR
jgi:glycosyltransferase involved in cell wall biosynthesis